MESSQYQFIRVENAPAEVLNEMAFLANAEVLSEQEGYLFSEKKFDTHGLRYYFNGSHPNIRVYSCADPTEKSIPKESFTKAKRNPLELLDKNWLGTYLTAIDINNGRQYVCEVTGAHMLMHAPTTGVKDIAVEYRVRTPLMRDQIAYGLSSDEMDDIRGWLAELGWAKAVPLTERPLENEEGEEQEQATIEERRDALKAEEQRGWFILAVAELERFIANKTINWELRVSPYELALDAQRLRIRGEL